jgi:hypothetical protein
MTYKQLTIFFPFPDLISIILEFSNKTKEQLLRERLNIEFRHKKILKDIQYTNMLNIFRHLHITNRIKYLNNDIEYLKLYFLKLKDI